MGEVKSVYATDHFRSRVAERIGTVDPEILADGLFWAIENGREDLVRYAGRIARNGRRIFLFRVPDGRNFYALINTETKVAITVLLPGSRILGEGKKYPLVNGAW